LDGRTAVAPYVPEIRSATDSSHFEGNMLDYDEVYDDDVEDVLRGAMAW
jgi:hypothetical protein